MRRAAAGFAVWIGLAAVAHAATLAVPEPGDIDYRSGYPLISTVNGTPTATTGGGFFANKITIPSDSKPLLVTHLGRYNMGGNVAKHEAAILRAKTGAHDADGVPSQVVASVVIDAAGPIENGFNFVRLERPVVLLPGESYYLASLEASSVGSGDTFPVNGSVSPTTNPMFGAVILDSHNYHMGAGGDWEAAGEVIGFAPLMNLKIN